MRYLDMLIAVGIAFLCMASFASWAAEPEGKITTINETNWRVLLTGEWLVKLWVTFAPYIIMIVKNIHKGVFIKQFRQMSSIDDNHIQIIVRHVKQAKGV